MDHEAAMLQEADEYFLRNRSRPWAAEGDPILTEIALWAAEDPPKEVLEIGCATGLRLQYLVGEYGSACYGLEASRLAVQAGIELHPAISFMCGIAPSALKEYSSGSFDLVILGFMQYLLPRDFELALAAELDRITKYHARVVAFDFLSPVPSSGTYAHEARLITYKTSPSSLLTWNPRWVLMNRRSFAFGSMSPPQPNAPDEWVTVDTLMKVTKRAAYPGHCASRSGELR